MNLKSFPGGFKNAKLQGIGYMLGQQLENAPRGMVITSEPADPARSALYTRKSAGAIRIEYPDGNKTRTLKNRGGNFQPFNQGRFGKSILVTGLLEQLKVVLSALQRLIPQSFDLVAPIPSQDRF